MKICSLLARLIRGLLFIANKYKILPLARAFLPCLLLSTAHKKIGKIKKTAVSQQQQDQQEQRQ